MIARVTRYPVKSMLGEELSSATLTARGVEDDRGYALIDVETGRVVSAKHPRKWHRMLTLAARKATADGAQVTITFPDGRLMCSDDPDLDATLSAFLGRAVHLSTEVPDQPIIERIDPLGNGEIVPENVDPTVTTSILARGAPKGTFFDYAPLHVIAAQTLARLDELSPISRFDAARFRPNLILDLPSAGAFSENEWRDTFIRIGETVVLRVERPTPRCAVPTLAQIGLNRDTDIIREIARHNRVPETGGRACLGAYAHVVQGGMIHLGDPIRLEQIEPTVTA